MRLHKKLITAFIVIILLMGISQSIFLESRIQSTFQEYLDQQNVNFMLRMEQVLKLYYEETGSWKNVQQFFFSNSTSETPGHPMMMRGMLVNMSMLNVDLLLLDRNGTIIADSTGTRIGANGNELPGKTQVLIVKGEKKGTLLLYQSKLQNLEEKFLYSSKIIILISGLIAAGVAVLFSFFIARKISNPLKLLMEGIRRIASGEKVKEVNILTNDEFHELGEAFNDMARKLERNEEIRRSLVADVAHELRTPLAILQGKLESIQEGVILPTEEAILELTDEVYRLSRLVQDLQQLSLAEAGKLPLNIQLVDLQRLIERICSNLQWLADEKKVTLKYADIPREFLLQIDSDRITQVIVNLIGNALHHTQEYGLVEISVKKQGNVCFIKVADTGCGIPEEILPFIFDRFYKRDPSRSRNEGNTGLGLSIAKGFVEAHGGKISVESIPNKRTVFTIILPILT
jgi:two-component system sensor histidine kinase BaeS